ncbi:MAG: glycosyltransferase family 2 protein [Candidatus Omnitrophota bacterium]
MVFKNDRDSLKKAISSFLDTGLNVHLYVIDNSPTDSLRSLCADKNVEYVFNNNNLGFGAGHNFAINKMTGQTKYFLIFNPDVYFGPGTLEKLFSFMENNKDTGLVMPKVLYPDGSLQYLCRLLPAPLDSLLRKVDIKILNPLFRTRKYRYELRFTDYNQLMDVPYLSGCFMFIRTEVFRKAGVFDERFFLYFEDVDLSRRINQVSRNVYFPEAIIYHGYERGSNKSIQLFGQLILSAIRYFNKWGWFFDRERALVNAKAMNKLGKY